MSTEKVDPALKPCPECGGVRVWTDTAGDNSISVKPRGTSSFNPGEALKPLVCTGCGLTTLYHPDPARAVKKSPDKSGKGR
ncbi:MAG TPA: hypothetical protein VH186_38375 [Chloroflexia bacterium]|nr:hypothetical protein [Chloroflexia bacterium]